MICERMILENNKNILYNVMSCLEFKKRYYLCLTTKKLFENGFKEFKHNELIKIEYEDNKLIDIWKNIMFSTRLGIKL